MDREADLLMLSVGSQPDRQTDRQTYTLLMLLSSYRTVFCFFSTAKTTPFFAIEEKQPVIVICSIEVKASALAPPLAPPSS